MATKPINIRSNRCLDSSQQRDYYNIQFGIVHLLAYKLPCGQLRYCALQCILIPKYAQENAGMGNNQVIIWLGCELSVSVWLFHR